MGCPVRGEAASVEPLMSLKMRDLIQSCGALFSAESTGAQEDSLNYSSDGDENTNTDANSISNHLAQSDASVRGESLDRTSNEKGDKDRGSAVKISGSKRSVSPIPTPLKSAPLPSSPPCTILKRNTTLIAATAPQYNPLSRSPPPRTPLSQRAGPIHGSARCTAPDTNASERVLQIERVLGYSGGPCLLLCEGKMLVIASGSMLVLIDTQGGAGCESAESPGLWKHFRSFLRGAGAVRFKGSIVQAEAMAEGVMESAWKGGGQGMGKGQGGKPGMGGGQGGGYSQSFTDPKKWRAMAGCEQAFLKGHKQNIGLLEVHYAPFSSILLCSAPLYSTLLFVMYVQLPYNFISAWLPLLTLSHLTSNRSDPL